MADQVIYPFKTAKQMETYLKKRKAHVGVAYTANVQFPKCYRSNMGYLFVQTMLCLVGILLALAAR